MTTRPSKLYRIGVCGGSGSGKTCLLTALSMARIAHPDGLACTWLPLPPGLTGADAIAYRDGRTWLDTCRNELKSGRKPEPNDPKATIFPRFRYQFTVTQPRPHTYVVELIDYSGELLNPMFSAAERATSLRRHLGEVDAFLVLAEAPKPGQEKGKLFEEFTLLQQAFALLRQERSGEPVLRMPLALLMNKWDRRHPEGGSQTEREEQVKQFLELPEQPPHVSLKNALQAAVAEQCFHVFALSAFGRSRTGSITDVEGRTSENVELPPLETPLPSFGLEEPFIWAAARRDALDLVDLHEQGNSLAFASPWPWLLTNGVAFWSSWKVWTKARELARRFPRSHVPEAARKTRRRALSITVLRSIAASILLFAALLGIEGLVDGVKNRQVAGHLHAPDRTMEQFAEDEGWLEGYATAPAFLHLLARAFVLSRVDARELQEQFHDRRESVLWSQVEKANPDPEGKELPADEYLKAIPNGKHTNEARAIVQRASDGRKRRANQDYIAAVKRELGEQLTMPRPDPVRLRALDDRLPKLPHPFHETPEDFAVRKKLADDIGAARVIVGGLNTKAKYEEMMASGRVREAAKILVDAQEQERKLSDQERKLLEQERKTLLAGFPARAMTRLEEESQRYRAEQRWRDATESIARATEDTNVIKLLGAEQLKKLGQMARATKIDEDRDLYEQLRRYKDLQHAQRYLEASPLKTMAREAKAYQEYILSQSEKLPLTLNLSKIEWGNAWDRKTNYTVYVGDKEVMDGKVNAATDKVNKDVDKADIQHRLDETITLKVEVKHIGTLKNTEYGSPSKDVKVRDIGQGVRLELDGKSPSSYVYFELSGVPREPGLPSYREE